MASGFSWLANVGGMKLGTEEVALDLVSRQSQITASHQKAQGSSKARTTPSSGKPEGFEPSVHDSTSPSHIIPGMVKTGRVLYQQQEEQRSSSSISSTSFDEWLADNNKAPSICSDGSSGNASDGNLSAQSRDLGLVTIEEGYFRRITNDGYSSESSSSSSSSENLTGEADDDTTLDGVCKTTAGQAGSMHDIRNLQMLREVFDQQSRKPDETKIGSINDVVLMQNSRNKENASPNKKHMRSLQEYMYNMKADKDKKLCYDVDVGHQWAYDEEMDCDREEMAARSAAAGRIRWGDEPVSGRYMYPNMDKEQRKNSGETTASCLRVRRRSIFRPTPRFVWEKTTLAEAVKGPSKEEQSDTVLDRCLSDPARRELLEEMYPSRPGWLGRISATTTTSSIMLTIPIQDNAQPSYGTFGGDSTAVINGHNIRKDGYDFRKVAREFGGHGAWDVHSLRESTADSMDTHYSNFAFLGSHRLDEKHEYYNLPSITNKKNTNPRYVSRKELLVPVSKLGKLNGIMSGYTLRLRNKLSPSGGTASPKKLGYLPVRVTDVNLEGVAAKLADWKLQRGARKVGYASQLSVIIEESYPPTPFSGLSREQTKAEVLAGLEDGSMGRAVGRKLVGLKSSIGSLGKRKGNERRMKWKIGEIGRIDGANMVGGCDYE